MKKRINLKWLALLLPLLAGCASDEPDEVAKEVPFRVPVLSTQRSSASAANNTTIEVEGSQVGFFVRSDANYAGVENQSYSYRSGIGWAPNGTPIWLKSEQAEMVAYYPWSSIITNAEYVNLVPQLRDPDAPQDLWYKHFFASSIDGDLSLTLMQAYSRLVITFVTDETYPSDPLLYELAIDDHAGDLWSYADLNMWTGTCRNQGYTESFVPFTTVDPAQARIVKKTVTDTAAKFDCLLCPQPFDEGKFIEFYITVGGEKYGIDTKQMQLDIPVSAFERELKAGNMYHLTIKISSRGLSFSTIDAQPWTNAPMDGDYGMS